MTRHSHARNDAPGLQPSTVSSSMMCFMHCWHAELQMPSHPAPLSAFLLPLQSYISDAEPVPLLSRDCDGRDPSAGSQPLPGTQFRQAREALGLGPAARRAPGASQQHDAAAETPAVRRVAFETPEPAAGGSPAAATRTPPALKAGYTPLTKEYLQVRTVSWHVWNEWWRCSPCVPSH